MKYLFIIILLTPLFLQSQWTARSGSNRFDGNYKVASVTGTGGEFPYKNPKLIINKFESGEPNIYLTGIGYTGCSLNRFKIAFDNDGEIYSVNSYNTSSDNDKEAIFINGVEGISINDFIVLLKTKGKLYLRLINSCGDNDYTFSLNGSTRAINYVIGDYYDKEKARMVEETKRREAKELVEKERQLIKEKKYYENIANINAIFFCGNTVKEAIKSKILFDTPFTVIDDSNNPRDLDLLRGYSITLYNQWKPDQILASIEDENNNIKEYYISSSQVDKLLDFDIIDERKTFKYISVNWVSLMPKCNE